MSELTLSNELTQAAVAAFWQVRTDQIQRLGDGGAAGGAARAAKHLDAIRDLVAEIFRDNGMPADSIIYEPYLPGYYRPRKRWDLAVKYQGLLVAAVEFKSQVGSVGKNFSNRFEEALGSSTDTRKAASENEAFGPVPPWLGYVFVLQESAETERSGGFPKATFPVDPIWKGQSYNERYQTMLSRFLGDGVYHAGWFITTRNDPEKGVVYSEPLASASAEAFRASIEGRVKYIKAVLNSSDETAVEALL